MAYEPQPFEPVLGGIGFRSSSPAFGVIWPLRATKVKSPQIGFRGLSAPRVKKEVRIDHFSALWALFAFFDPHPKDPAALKTVRVVFVYDAS